MGFEVVLLRDGSMNDAKLDAHMARKVITRRALVDWGAY